MANSSRRRILIVVIVATLLLLALWLARCSKAGPRETAVGPSPASSAPPPPPVAATPAAREAAEVLTPATVQVPPQISAGAGFPVQWTGPDNRGDYLTIVHQGAPDGAYANNRETRDGSPLSLTAPIEPGKWEVRYVAVRSRTVLGRAPITVMPIEATLSASDEVVQGTSLPVTWIGPNNAGDYITVVAKDTPDGRFGNYTHTSKGSPLNVTMPIATGDAELRYVTGQGAKVLARRPLKIVAAGVTLAAPAEAIAGSLVTVEWTGPNNASDYITLVARSAPDGQHGNSTYTVKGSPLPVTAPIEAGDVELRYMTGQGAKVLARRPIKIIAAEVNLSAPAEAVAGSAVTVNWTGPNNLSDYITLVARSAHDGQYGASTYTVKGSPLIVTAPIEAGEVEVRYMAGQGAKVLARRPIRIIAADITLSAPAEAAAGSNVTITWTGPNFPGDYITMVAKTAGDVRYGIYTYTTKGSPLTVIAPKDAGDAEVRYVSGQGDKVLMRRPIKIVTGRSGDP